MIPLYVIIHHSLTHDSQTVSWQAIRDYHVIKLGWSAIGYHYGIELVNTRYEILTGRMLNEVGAHCRNAGMNRKSVAICVVGNFDKDPPTEEAWNTTIRLTRSMMEIFDISSAKVLGHREAGEMDGHDWRSGKYKSCPGAHWDMEIFRRDL